MNKPAAKRPSHQYVPMRQAAQKSTAAQELIGIGRQVIIGLCWFLVVLTFPFSLCFCLRVVKDYERAVIFRLGRIYKDGLAGPGLVFTFPCIDRYQKVDLRLVTYNVPPQEILSMDSVTVNVDAVVYFRINNALFSICNVANCDYSTQLLAQSTLRNILGTKTLTEILSERVVIAHQMKHYLDGATAPWGVQVERVEVKNVRLPELLQRAMAAEAEATRNAKASIIAAEGEQRASAALRQAADVISRSKFALQLRYLQTLSSISAEKESTILFPVPININQLFKPPQNHAITANKAGDSSFESTKQRLKQPLATAITIS